MVVYTPEQRWEVDLRQMDLQKMPTHSSGLIQIISLSFHRTNIVVYTFVYASLSGPATDRLTEAHFDLGGYVNK